jgi:hypothetical protein
VLPSGKKLKPGNYTLLVTAAGATGTTEDTVAFTLSK